MCGPPSFFKLKCTPCAATSLQSNVAQADGTKEAKAKSANGKDRDVRDGAMAVCADVWMMGWPCSQAAQQRSYKSPRKGGIRQPRGEGAGRNRRVGRIEGRERQKEGSEVVVAREELRRVVCTGCGMVMTRSTGRNAGRFRHQDSRARVRCQETSLCNDAFTSPTTSQPNTVTVRPSLGR
jgi:hypothetical protein